MANRSRYDRFIKKAVELGAEEAKLIDTGTIITAPWVRLKCQFGCGGYKSSYCCPPNSPTPEETRAVLECYQKAILIHCKGHVSVTKIVITLERIIFLSGFYRALGFGAGPCSLCKTCAVDGCKHPEKARPSMEACGIDVYMTARSNGYPIEVVIDKKSDENYYGVVLVE
jgi:predicted metal-binding protein